MRGRLVRRGVATVAALAVGVAGAVGVVPTVAQAAPIEGTPFSVPGMAVSLAQAGELALWGDNSYGQSTLPASLAGVAISQVVFPDQATLALTAAGRVVGWGSNQDRLERVPDAVTAAKVTQIVTQGNYAGAVTSDGRVLMWGRKKNAPTPLDVPAGLSGVKQLALSEFSGAALKNDGSVVAWGLGTSGQTVPAGLKATAIQAMGTGTFYALTEAGTVTTFGNAPSNPAPAALQEAGNVKAIATASNGAIALLADNTTVIFGMALSGDPAEIDRRSAFTSREAVLISSGTTTNEFAIVDRDRAIHTWADDDRVGAIPAELSGRALVQIVLAHAYVRDVGTIRTGGVISTKLLSAELPQVSGTATVGSVLTGVPGTFSAVPDSVTSQWLVGGVPAGSGAQLTVTEAMVGKSIAYQSTASKAGETVSSTSTAVTAIKPATPPPPAPVKVASKTKVAKVSVAKKAASVAVTGKVTASKSPAGKAKVTIKKGKKIIVTKTVAVSAKGALKLTVKKFAKLVAKKLKAKGKMAKTAYRGKYVVSIAYAGNAQVKPSAGSARFTIKK